MIQLKCKLQAFSVVACVKSDDLAIKRSDQGKFMFKFQKFVEISNGHDLR